TAGELEQLLVDMFPIEPGDLVVLTIGVVVALLRAADLVPSEQHRNALGEKKRRQDVALLPQSGCVDRCVIGGPLDAAVPRPGVAFAVVAVLAVRLVVFLVVGNEVSQREAVVRSHEVHAGVWPSPVVLIEVGAARETAGEFAQSSPLPAPVVPNCIAIPAIPLAPSHRKIADLVTAFTQIPGLGD